MPQSRHYITMEAQIKKLGKHYLGFRAKSSGDYSDRQLSAGAAFTVFAHAEFESFLESWATTILQKSEANWKTGKIDRALAHLLMFREAAKSPGQVPKSDIWSEPCALALKAHEGVIGKNNGIREAHICGLLAPLGFDVRKIDPILLGDLTAFAAMRGNHAHQSYRLHIGQQFDPFDRQAKAKKLVSLLKDFDDEMVRYRKKI